METDDRLQDWLSSRLEDATSRKNYMTYWRIFSKFCVDRGKEDPSLMVEQFRAVKYQGEAQREKFLDEWRDLLRAYGTWVRGKYSPTSQNYALSVVKSFLKFYDLPLRVELPKRVYVKFPTRDLQKPELRVILARASQRDRVFWLCQAESGIRASTLLKLRYENIREDFEREKVPMMISTPAEILKAHVGDRWSFIGEDGYRALREYLAPRMPLKAQDRVFTTESPGMLKGEQFSLASISVKFRRICDELGMEKGPFGKPGKVRMNCLRKFFRNNFRGGADFREFWMGHTNSVDPDHYFIRDHEIHRKEYQKNYEELRILEPITTTLKDEIQEKFQKKDLEIQDLRAQVQELKTAQETVRHLCEMLQKIGKEKA